MGFDSTTGAAAGKLGAAARLRKYGTDSMREPGRKGGISTREKYGLPYMREIGRRGGKRRHGLEPEAAE